MPGRGRELVRASTTSCGSRQLGRFVGRRSAAFGIDKVRSTGGEPLVRKGIESLAACWPNGRLRDLR